jgi:hypothetical protein
MMSLQQFDITIPEGEESTNDTVCKCRSVPWDGWDLPGDVLRAAWSVKSISPILTEYSTNHSQWIAHWKRKEKMLLNQSIRTHELSAGQNFNRH